MKELTQAQLQDPSVQRALAAYAEQQQALELAKVTQQMLLWKAEQEYNTRIQMQDLQNQHYQQMLSQANASHFTADDVRRALQTMPLKAGESLRVERGEYFEIHHDKKTSENSITAWLFLLAMFVGALAYLFSGA
jgi:hypothetical protein